LGDAALQTTLHNEIAEAAENLFGSGKKLCGFRWTVAPTVKD
jgi:hypothetical protein